MSEQIIAGVGAVVFRGGDVLLIRRGREPFLGQWSIPGGRIEPGEALRDAVAREVREETGVEIRLGELIDVFESLPRAVQDRHFLMIDFLAEWIAGEPVAGDDALEAAFVPLDAALSLVAWDVTRGAIRKAAQIRARLEAPS